jgi:hypothetical protein
MARIEQVYRAVALFLFVRSDMPLIASVMDAGEIRYRDPIDAT